MDTVYTILTILAVLIAVLFILVVLLTGKGDAMSGGSGSIRTSFKGKASFDDFISRLTLSLAVIFIVLMIGLDMIATKLH